MSKIRQLCSVDLFLDLSTCSFIQNSTCLRVGRFMIVHVNEFLYLWCSFSLHVESSLLFLISLFSPVFSVWQLPCSVPFLRGPFANIYAYMTTCFNIFSNIKTSSSLYFPASELVTAQHAHFDDVLLFYVEDDHLILIHDVGHDAFCMVCVWFVFGM